MSVIIRRAISKEDKDIADLKGEFVAAPRLQQFKKFSANEASANVALAYHRGRQAQKEEDIKKLKKYPAAAKLLK